MGITLQIGYARVSTREQNFDMQVEPSAWSFMTGL